MHELRSVYAFNSWKLAYIRSDLVPYFWRCEEGENPSASKPVLYIRKQVTCACPYLLLMKLRGLLRAYSTQMHMNCPQLKAYYTLY